MTMLDATDPAFQERHPFGATVHDAHGRHLARVMACNPLTGEVVMVDMRPSLWDQMVRPFRRTADGWLRKLVFGHGIHYRHGFWPAPLTVTSIDPRWRDPREAHDALMNRTCRRLLEDLL